MVEEEVFLANEDDELAVWYDESLSAFIDDPEDDEVLANFRDARRALGQARTSRGFYPVKDPNLNRGSGFATSKGRGKGRGFNRDNQFAAAGFAWQAQYRELPGCLLRGSCFSLGSRRSCSHLRRRRLIITTHHKPTYHITTSHHNLSHTNSSQLHFSHLTHHSSTTHHNSSQLHF